MEINKIKTTELEIAVAQYFGYRNNTVVPNVYWGFGFDYEADVIIVSPSGYIKEVEIKINKQDLMRDKKKKLWHNNEKIRHLYFAVPHDWDEDFIFKHIPKTAGVLSYKKDFPLFEIRKAKTNTAAPKISERELSKLRHLGCMRIWVLKQKLLNIESNK